MRILELEIHNIRGICELYFYPNGENFVVWGPNGSGKSAVVDAIDFLLTGRISRLIGKGTGDIKLHEHGPHIDHKPEEALVRAVISIPNVTQPVEIKRCLSNPNDLECSDEKVVQHLGPIISLARRGQHILTRREILKYITAEPSTRAQEIQELLNISEIEEIRKALVRVESSCKNEWEGAKSAISIAQGAINATVQQPTFLVETVLQVVNENRAILGAKPIFELNSKELKKNIEALTLISKEIVINTALLKQDIDSLIEVKTEPYRKKISDIDKELRSTISVIKSDPKLLKGLKRLRLISLGIEMIEEDGACPLCDIPWPPDKLREYLEERLSDAKTALQHQNNINKLSEFLTNEISSTLAKIKTVIDAAVTVGLKEEISILQPWFDNLRKLLDMLGDPIDKYPDPQFPHDQVQQMILPPEIEKIFSNIKIMAESKYPATTPEQNAWDTLTRLEENLKILEQAMAAFKKAELIYKRAILLHTNFISARDSILKQLYDDVRNRFVNLYRSLHGTDETQFKAIIQPDEAGLDFKVDFYGRGIHAPHALHSEGHQDSMGLCLYLSLAERLTAGMIDLIILDDVVMSVDADHRRQVCSLLARSFPNNQFFITTHDKTWANQLRSEGIVDSKGMIEFYNWHIETGPQVNYEIDMWKKIDEDMEKSDISGAAGRLRHGAEQFFGMVCESLQVPVVYKLSGQYELGHLLPPAMHQYRKLLKQAKSVAQSWNKAEVFEMLQEADDITGSIYSRTNAEQWAVNANVHYNNWANFTRPDFQPVVEAFQDLFALFVCSKCGGMLHLVISNMIPEAVRCNCSQVDWNLVEKR